MNLGDAHPTVGQRTAGETYWVLCAVAVATVLRLFRLGQNSLWIDEFASMQVAALTLAQIPGAALHGSAFEPPVYFWLLHGVRSLFGSSESALRALSAVAGILTVPVTWLLVRDLTGRGGGAIIAAFLVATNPLHVWYSQEARPYALSLLFGLASLLSLRLAVRTGRGAAWIGYAALGALSVLSHLVGIVAPAVAAVWVALDPRRREVGSRFAAASAGLLLLIAPFLIALAQSIEPGSTGSPPRSLTGLELPYNLFTFVAGYSFGPAVREIQNLGWRVAVQQNPVQTVIGGAALVAALGLALHARRRTVWHLDALLILPLTVAILGAAVTTKAYSVRYTLPALIGFLGIIGVASAELRPVARGAIVGALLAVFLWADLQWFLVSRYWKEDSRAAVACLGNHVLATDTVAVAPGYMTGLVTYYARAAGTGMSVVGVSSAGDLGNRPAALLTTRLHHVAEAAALIRAFRDGADAPLLEGEVPGYQMLAVSAAGTVTGTRLACETAE